MTRVPIHFPLGGISDDQAFSQQEPGTTREAINVRGIDPVEGRTRGAQRSGLTKHVSVDIGATNEMVQDLVIVTRDVPKTQYDVLYTSVQPLEFPTVEWERIAPSGDDSWWAAVDVSENVYVLTGASAINKYNSEGVLLRSIGIPAVEGHTVVRKITVDTDGGVYAATFSDNDNAGLLFRFADSSTSGEELEEHWRINVPDASVEMFDVGSGVLYFVARHGAGIRARTLRLVTAITTSVPEVVDVIECPGPVNQMVVNPEGAVIMAVGESRTRGAATGSDGSKGHTHSIVSDDLWSHHELVNANQRIYFHVDAMNIDGEFNATLEDGDEIEVWKDRRDQDTLDGSGDEERIIDRTKRDFKKTSGRHGPSFSATGVGGHPGLFFDGARELDEGGASATTGEGLITEINPAGNVTKVTATDTSWEASKAVFPNGAKSMTFMVVKPVGTNLAAVAVQSWGEDSVTPPSTRGKQTNSVLSGAQWKSTSVAGNVGDSLSCPDGSANTGTIAMQAGASPFATDEEVNWSISLWVKFPGISSNQSGIALEVRSPIFSWTDGTANAGLELYITADAGGAEPWRVALRDGNGANRFSAIAEGAIIGDGEWHHIVVVCGIAGADRGASFYLDGFHHFTSTTNAMLWPDDTGAPMIFGTMVQNENAILDLLVDDVRQFDFVIDQTDVDLLGDPATADDILLFGGTERSRHRMESLANTITSGNFFGNLTLQGTAVLSSGDGATILGLSSDTWSMENTTKGVATWNNRSTNSMTDAGAGELNQHPLSYNYDNDATAFIICIVNNGADAATDPDGEEDSVLLVNGRVIDVYGGAGIYTNGTESWTILGNINATEGPDDPLAVFLPADNVGSFTGYICEIITILGDTPSASPLPHHQSIICPGQAHLGMLTGGSASPWDALHDTSIVTEVERMFGQLAHKWGLAHLMPHGYIDATVNPFGTGLANHPFGGTGEYPLSATAISENLKQSEARRDAWKMDNLLLKFDPGAGLFSWGIPGSGLGHTLTVGDDKSVLGFGSRTTRDGTGTHLGPDNIAAGDENTIARRVIDRGENWGSNIASRGFIAIKGFDDSTTSDNLPLDGDTVTIDDGNNTPVIFEFDDDSSVTGTNTAVTIPVSSPTPSTTLDVLVTAINAQGALLDITARRVGNMTVQVYIDTSANCNTANAAITLNAAADDRFVVNGLRDGTIEANTWTLTDANFSPSVEGFGMATDDEGDPWLLGHISGSPDRATKFSHVDGTILTQVDLGAGSQTAYSIALPLSHPDYIDQTASPVGPLFAYVGSSGGALDPQEQTITKLRLITETQTIAADNESPRITRLLAVSGGKIHEVTTGPDASTEVDSNVFLVADSPYIFSTALFNKVYWTDGDNYVVYDAILDTIKKMESLAAGPLPRKARILESWLGALLYARTEDDAHNVHFSRIGEPQNLDEFPPVPDGLEAVSFGNSQVGRSGDIINGLVPYSDDLLIVGGDHTIQRLTGHPNAGGQLDLISDITGMAYGRAWAKDPEGRLFFFGSKGGVFVMVPGSLPKRITRDRIERRMADLDLSVFRVELAWDRRAEGLRVFTIPYAQPTLGSGQVTSPAWFLDKTGAWWEDEYARNNEAPTAIVTFDGDLAADRKLLIGGGDGFLRFVDENAVNDDGQRIDSRVLIGPLAPSTTQGQLKFMRPQVTLGSAQSGCDFEWFTSDTAEITGDPVASGKLNPGQNPTLPVRTRGAAVWLRLRNAAISERWAFERASIDVAPGGRERVR